MREGVEPLDFIVDEEYSYLVDWFWELSTSRTFHFGGANPISYQEMHYWCRVMGIILRREEVRVIRQMDEAFLRVSNTITKEQLDDRPVGPQPKVLTARVSVRLTPDNFDKMFDDG